MTAEEALSYLHSIREHLRYLTQQDADDKVNVVTGEAMESQPDLAAVVKKNSLREYCIPVLIVAPCVSLRVKFDVMCP
ncbi:hypothetical protein E2C01_100897 [Portunus trituberculatus]|uniref:Uncharacterized protein n=1 Tax=Portunus trituberculatus TaxID=210409 RepID=A0A5B7KE77_PORTR|nr:hypothetical protein [Portunus trituberculatus]